MSTNLTPEAIDRETAYSPAQLGWEPDTFTFDTTTEEEQKAAAISAASDISVDHVPNASAQDIQIVQATASDLGGFSTTFDQQIMAVTDKSDQVTEPANPNAISDPDLTITKILAAHRAGEMDKVKAQVTIRDMMQQGKTPAEILSALSTNTVISQNIPTVLAGIQSGQSIQSIVDANNISKQLGDAGRYLVEAVATQAQAVLESAVATVSSVLFAAFNAASIPPAAFTSLFNYKQMGGNATDKSSVYHSSPTANSAVNVAEPINSSDSRGSPSVNDVYNSESQVNRLASGQDVHKTVVQEKDSKRERNIPIALKDHFFDEPASPYNAAYPHNQVKATKNGLVEEFDDTPNNVRYHMYHPSGSYKEVDNNGTLVEKIVGDRFVIVAHNDQVYIKGQCTITVEGDCNLLVKNSINMEVEGSMKAVIKNDMSFTVNGDMSFNVREQMKFKADHILFEYDEMDQIGRQVTTKLSGSQDITASDIHIKAGSVTTDATKVLVNAADIHQVKANKTLVDSEQSYYKANTINMKAYNLLHKVTNLYEVRSANTLIESDDVYFNSTEKNSRIHMNSVSDQVPLPPIATSTIDPQQLDALRDAIATFLGQPGLRATPSVPRLADLPRMSRENKAAMESDGIVGIKTVQNTTAGIGTGGANPTSIPTPGCAVSIDSNLYPSAKTPELLDANTATLADDKRFNTFDFKKIDSSKIKHTNVDVSDIMNARNIDQSFPLSKHYTIGQAMDLGNWPIRPQNGLTIQQIVANMRRAAVHILDPLVELYGKSNMRVTSGWRYGTSSSHHNIGSAYDVMFLDVPKAQYPARAAEIAAAFSPICDQIIYEYNWSGKDYICNWIHLAYIGNNPRAASDPYKVFTRCENAKTNYPNGIYDPYKGKTYPVTAIASAGNRPSGSII